MNLAASARATTYATTLLFGLAMLAKMLGFAEFDEGSGMFDPAPFNIYVLVAPVAMVISSGLALIALIKGWGSKKNEH